MGKQFYINDINKDTKNNTDFRRVIFTGSNLQLVLMSIGPGEDIGGETHSDVDQFIRVESGFGMAVIDGTEYELRDDFAVTIPAGVNHNIINKGSDPLKVYSIYAPPQHKENEVEAKKIKENYMKTNNVLDFNSFVNERLNEAKINSEKEFTEYATKLLKKAHGSNYDQTKADETIKGILSKAKGDFGTAVGILTSSVGK